jgi:hypothetical protein
MLRYILHVVQVKKFRSLKVLNFIHWCNFDEKPFEWVEG